MNRKSLSERDLREVPAYSIAEAAGYLRIPKSTLRAWLLGQQSFRSVIEIADRKERRLSFINLVEAHVLNAIRRTHHIALPKVRTALNYLKRQIGSPRPLVDRQFATDGVDLFIEYYGQLMNITQPGQYALREVLSEHLQLIRRDPQGVPMRLFLFPGRAERSDREPPIMIDPKISFGRPVLVGTGISTIVLAQRFEAGESMDELAHDYGRPRAQIEEAIRFERRAA